MTKGLFSRVNDELKAREKTPGLNIGELYALEDALLRSLLIFMVREKEATLAQIAAHIKKDEAATLEILQNLISQGYAREIEVKDKPTTYRVRLLHTKQSGGTADVWQALVSKLLAELGEEADK